MMQIKAGVKVDFVEPFLSALNTIGNSFLSLNLPWVLTSGVDGTHRPGSLHYLGLAGDFRLGPQYARSFRENVASRVRADLAKWCVDNSLPGRFDVVLEPRHLHVEYDRRVLK